MEITKFADLKCKFENALENTPNRDFLLHTETTELIEFINYIPNFRTFKKKTYTPFIKTGKSVFEIDAPDLNRKFISAGFQGYSKTSGFRLGRSNDETDEMHKIKLDCVQQGAELLKYYNWLNKIFSTPPKKSKAKQLTLNQKILALDYLGIDLSNQDKTKTAKILSAILGMDEQNIRECLTYINVGRKNDIRSKNNLQVLHELFQNQSSVDISAKVLIDIESL